MSADTAGPDMLGQYILPVGVERVLSGQPAAEAVVRLLDHFGYRRVFIVCSRTLNTRTPVIDTLRAAIGDRLVGSTDEVGEHAPIGNVLRAAALVRDAGADVIVSVGGGSVLDFSKFIQLCLSENAYTKEELLRFQWRTSADGMEYICTSTAEPRIRQIAVPTTLAAAEWTPSGTPVDEATRQKVRLRAVRGAPQAIVYDPAMLTHTPRHLLFSTAIRGLDHAINSYVVVRPHPFADLLALEAVKLYVANLPRVAQDGHDLAALAQCQRATWYSGMVMTTMAPLHGFSHFMVHVLAPYAGLGHSETAAVMMLAQARWIEAVGEPRVDAILAAIGRPGARLSTCIEKLLRTLGLPTTLGELGVSREQLEATIPLALKHPGVMRHNVRPIRDEMDLRAVLALVDDL